LLRFPRSGPGGKGKEKRTHLGFAVSSQFGKEKWDHEYVSYTMGEGKKPRSVLRPYFSLRNEGKKRREASLYAKVGRKEKRGRLCRQCY